MHRDAVAGGNVPALGGEALVCVGTGNRADRAVPDRGLGARAGMPSGARPTVGAAGAGPRGGGVGRGDRDRRHPRHRHPGGDRVPARSDARSGECPSRSPARCEPRATPRWDGPRNLRDAAAVAASTASRGRGAVVVFNGEIFAGRTATKTHATDIAAFSAPHARPDRPGREKAGSLIPSAAADRPQPLEPTAFGARVALVPMVVGDDGRMLDLARPGHDGVVIEAFGSGNLPPGAVPAIRRWLDERKAGRARDPLSARRGHAVVRLRGRRRPPRGDGSDTRRSAHAVAGADGADDRALRGRPYGRR